MRRLCSQAREITVWISGSRFNYVIPIHSGLETVLGASLEVEVDLSQSERLHKIYQGIARNHRVETLTPSPQKTIPLELSLGFERQRWKTILKAQEVSLLHQRQPIEQSYVDVSCEKEKEASLRLQ